MGKHQSSLVSLFGKRKKNVLHLESAVGFFGTGILCSKLSSIAGAGASMNHFI